MRTGCSEPSRSVSGSRSRCEVQIVATVREDRLRRLLSDGGETANVARRFVARARRATDHRRQRDDDQPTADLRERALTEAARAIVEWFVSHGRLHKAVTF